MKCIPVVILAVVALVAGVTGCDSMRRYDARLAAADSLMHTHPDSALAIVQALTADSLASEGDRAYRDLLLTQARYRCYITATSDSDINRALSYYRAHSGEREKLTRALIYKGAVMEELSHPDSAMLYYKQAEATADPDDYFNLGYINLRIAELYQVPDIEQNAVISRLKKAQYYFKHCFDTNYQIVATGTLGSYLFDTDKDSAIMLMDQAVELARAINSPEQYFYQSKLAGNCFYDSDYYHSKELAMDIIRNGRDYCEETQFYYYAAISFIKLGQLDSALWVQSIIPEPQSLQDSLNYYILNAELAQAQGQLTEYHFNLAQSEIIHRKLLSISLESNHIKEAENNWDSMTNSLEIKKHTRTVIVKIIVFGILSAIIGVIILYLLIKRRIQHYRNELDQAEHELIEMMSSSLDVNSKLNAERKQHRAIIDEMDRKLNEVTKKYNQLAEHDNDINQQAAHIARIRQTLLNDLYHKIRIKTSSQNKKRKTISLINLIKEMNEKKAILHLKPDESFWNRLKQLVDIQFDGLASFMETNYPNLSIDDHRLLWMSCINISPQIIRLCLDYTNAGTVSNYKRKLIKEKIGRDVKFDEFVKMYLDGRLMQN